MDGGLVFSKLRVRWNRRTGDRRVWVALLVYHVTPVSPRTQEEESGNQVVGPYYPGISPPDIEVLPVVRAVKAELEHLQRADATHRWQGLRGHFEAGLADCAPIHLRKMGTRSILLLNAHCLLYSDLRTLLHAARQAALTQGKYLHFPPTFHMTIDSLLGEAVCNQSHAASDYETAVEQWDQPCVSLPGHRVDQVSYEAASTAQNRRQLEPCRVIGQEGYPSQPTTSHGGGTRGRESG